MNCTRHLLIKGKVTGVFYRANAKDEAEKSGVTGWIKNTDDDNVEAIVSGREEDVNRFIDWCRRGPQRAKVDEVIVTKHALTSFNTFNIIK